MFAKELRDVWWKGVVGLGVVALNIALFLQSYDYANGHMIFYGGGGVDEFVLSNLSDTVFTGLGMALALTAVIVGAGAVNREINGDTVFNLLSKPLSRRSILLSKYASGAACLLGVSVVGVLLFWAGGFVLGYPMGDFGYLMSTRDVAVLWLASLVVLGLSMLVSTLTQNVLASLIISATLTATLFFCGPLLVATGGFFYEVTGIELLPGIGTFGSEAALTEFLWTRFYLAAYLLPEYGGLEVPVSNVWTTNLSVLVLAAALPLLVTLWVFERKKF